MALALKARAASEVTAMRKQRHPLRKRLATAATVKGLVQLVGAKVAAAVTALGERGGAQVAAIGPLSSVLAHVDDQRRPCCSHVVAHGAVTGIGTRRDGNSSCTSHLHLAHDFCGRKRTARQLAT